MKKIDHVNIVVSNLEESITFFEDLGFASQGINHLAGDWIEDVVGLKDVKARFVALAVPDGYEEQTVIELIEYEQPKGSLDPDISQPNQLGFRHMAFRVQNIEAWLSLIHI